MLQKQQIPLITQQAVKKLNNTQSPTTTHTIELLNSHQKKRATIMKNLHMSHEQRKDKRV